MSISLILLIAAGVAFVLEAITDNFPVRWWAVGVALYLFSQAAA